MSCINLFNLVIASSIKGCCIIFCIILLKYMLKGRLGARFHYYVWFILLIRLMMPYAINSPVSLFNLLNVTNQEWMSDSSYGVNLQNANQMGHVVIEDGLPMEEMMTSQHLLNIIEICATVWLIGIAVILTYTIIANVQFRKAWQRNIMKTKACEHRILAKCKLTMGIKKDIPIFYTNTVSAPVQYGLIHPCILLPASFEDVLSEDERACVILHELSHIKRKDIAVFWLMTILKAIYWFNPVIWYGLYRMRQDCEIACDALALSYMRDNENQKYGYTIIHMLQNTTSAKAVSAAGITGNKSQIIRRLKMIALFKKNTYKLSLASIAILVAMGCMFLTNAEEKKIDTQPQAPQLEAIEEIEEQAENNEMMWPLPVEYNRIVSPYGWRSHPLLEEKKLHTGIDIIAPLDVDIIASQKGTITHADVLGGYGETIIIQHDNGIETIYAHCNELLVNEGDIVETGDIIARVGNSGTATGAHLHFEVRKDGEYVDPLGKYLKVTAE